MVTHELTVFPDGRIDGAFSVREGDYNSHTLRFVLTQDLTAASAKLLLWPAGAAKPTVYGVLLGHGQAAGQDVQFTPVSWGKAPSHTQLQLELLDNNGNIIWQSRRMSIPVEPGIPDDALPEPVDTSDATAGPGDVALGKTFYAQGEKKTGSYVSDGIRPRAWADIPIDYIKGLAAAGANTLELYFQRIGSTEFMLVFPENYSVSAVKVTIAVDEATEIYRETVKVGDAAKGTPLVLEGIDFAQPVSFGLKWGEKEITISADAMPEDSEHACVDAIRAAYTTSGGTTEGAMINASSVVTRKGEVFYYAKIRTSAMSAGDTLEVRCRSKGKALLCRNGRVRPTATGIAMTEIGPVEDAFFEMFEIVSPDGRYWKKYCITSYDENAGASTLEMYAYPAKAFVNGDADFYDYARAGYAPTEPQPEKADILAAVASLSGSGKGIRDKNGRILLGSAGTENMIGIIAAEDHYVLDAVDENLTTNFAGMHISLDDNGDLKNVGILGKGTLTKGSRWLVLANDKLVDMPGFLENVWPAAGATITLIYTCADGLDVGYPYAGE